MILGPFTKSRSHVTQIIMLDVVIALLPLLCASWLAYGNIILQQLAIAVSTALLTELIFSALLLKKFNTVLDGSAIVTSLLLVCTISPITPWYILVFGSFSAILFGKIVWGGLGKNRFNPALVGREFMTVFFASVMTSGTIWKTQDLTTTTVENLFPAIENTFIADHLNFLIFKTNGAMGEYSIVALILGGLYLLLRHRISWHIPCALLLTFTLLMWLPNSQGLSYSMGGILLGTLFMATDMPSSPTTAHGKLYYGMMIAVVTYLFIKSGIRYEYMSYSILLLNGFADRISLLFRPQVWGEQRNWRNEVENIFLLTLQLLAIVLAVITVYYYGFIDYLIYIYIIYIIIKFNYSYSNKVNNVI